MGKLSVKLLVSFMQIRYLQTQSTNTLKAASNLATVSEICNKKEVATLRLRQNENSVIDFLKTQQFSDTQIARLVKSYPAIVRCNVGTNLKPKFEFLNEIGFKSNLVTELILKTPNILCRSLNAHLIPSVEYLKTLLVVNNETNFLIVLKRASWLLNENIKACVKPNVDLLLKEGVPMDNIRKLFTSQPRTLLYYGHRMEYGIEMAKKFGIHPSQRVFIYAFRVFSTYTELNLSRKIELMKSFGWSDEDIASSILHHPYCLTCSEDKLKAIMDYFSKTVKVDPKTVIAYPKVIMYSLEKRIIPRCQVFLALRDKKLVKRLKLTSLLNGSEEEFVDKYIVKYLKEVPDLLDAYQGWKKDGVSIQRK